MIGDGQIVIKLVIYQPDPKRQKNYTTIVMADQVVVGEWYTSQRTLPADDLPAFTEKFRRTGARHGFEFSDNPPLFSNSTV